MNIPAIVIPFLGDRHEDHRDRRGHRLAQFDRLLPDHQRISRPTAGDGGLHSASLVLAQTDFEQIERNQREGRWDLVGDLLAEQGNKLKAAGADFFLLACNTVHTTADRIEGAVDLPFLHIVDPTAGEVQQRGVTTVGLLGSRYTMTGSYFVGRLREH